MKTYFERKLVVAFALAAALTLAVGGFAHFTARGQIDDTRRVDHTHSVLAKFREVLSLCQDIQAGHRGFALSGDESFLSRHISAVSDIKNRLGELRRLTADNQSQQKRIDDLDVKLRQYIELSSALVETRRQSGLDVVAQVISTGVGESLMNDIRQTLADISKEEEELLALRHAAAGKSARIAAAVRVALILLIVGLMATMYVAIAREIERRVKAQEETRRAEAFVNSIIENLPNMVFVKDAKELRFRQLNRAGEQLLGYSRQELIGKSDYDFFEKEMADFFTSKDRQVLTGGEVVDIPEEPVETRHKGTRILHTKKVPIDDGNGEPVYLLGISEDITEKKAAEAELRRSQAISQSLFESLPGLYLVLTPDLRIVAASDAYLEATMTKREAILGRGLFDVFPDNPDDPVADGTLNLRASLDRVLQTARPDRMAIQKYDVRSTTGEFVEKYWSPINSPVLGSDRKVEYIIHRVEDVTDFVKRKARPVSDTEELRARMEQMEAEIYRSSQEVQAANRQLQAANKELEAFSYSVSHDLRTPLRSIEGFSQIIEEEYADKLDEEGRSYLQRVRKAVSRMGDLIDDLLQLARITRAEIRKEVVDITALARAVSADLAQSHPDRTVEVTVSEGLQAEADLRLMRVALENLIGNAWKFTGRTRDAVIEVGHLVEKSSPVFYVKDNGAGFDPAYADRLFGAFERLHDAADFPGTGIGLATVHRIVTRHGGRIWAESKPGCGASFFFQL